MAITLDGNSNVSLTYSSGGRITGDFTNATIANRALFQTSTVNGQSRLTVIPNGTDGTAALDLYSNAADLANSPRFTMRTGATDMAFLATREGTGSFLPMTFQTGGSERFRIDTSGNVGIGTTSPAANVKLSVNGTIQIATGTTISAGCIFTNVNYGMLFQAYQASPALADFAWFNSAGTERARIDSSGNLLVGTTTNTNTAKVFALTSSGTVGFASQGYSGDVSSPAAIFGKYDNNTTTSQIFARFTVNNNAAGSGQINANGASAAAFGSYSDIRLKENIAPLPDQLANICALKPSEFDYKDGTGHQIGFIAQEMQEVYPDVVGEGEDGMLTITGWSKTEARLVKAIQELTTRLEALEAQ